MATDKAAFFDQGNIDQLPWPDTLAARRVKALFLPVIKNGPRMYINNVDCPVGALCVGKKVFPVVIESRGSHSHVGSLYGHYIVSACEEAGKLSNPFFRRFSRFFVEKFGKILCERLLSRNVQVDQWLMTTNLHDEITSAEITAIVDFFKIKYPDRAIIVRTLAERTDDDLMRSLRQHGFSFIASRQVYIWDYTGPLKLSLKARHALKKDDALAAQAGYEWRDLDLARPQEVSRILDLYRQLYLDKYSWHNPQYTPRFIEELCAGTPGLLRIKVLSRNERVDGFIGYYVCRGILTAPLVGYDTQLPQKVGLYRMLMSRIRQEAEEQNLVLNGSAGAGEFKRSRGGDSRTEFCAVYIRHLDFFRRFQWLSIKRTMNTIGMQILQSNVL
ncbi:MAG: GNAT family N-acetyltransferase [Candidatus Omnitrophota bacterium]